MGVSCATTVEGRTYSIPVAVVGVPDDAVVIRLFEEVLLCELLCFVSFVSGGDGDVTDVAADLISASMKPRPCDTEDYSGHLVQLSIDVRRYLMRTCFMTIVAAWVIKGVVVDGAWSLA